MIELTPKLNQFILTLYQGAYEKSLSDFKPWVFQYLQNVIQFNSGLWLSRSDMTKPIPVHWVDDTYLFNQPVNFMENYQRLATMPNNIDPLHDKLLNAPDKVISLWEAYSSREEWYQTNYYQDHSKKYEIEHMLSTLALSKSNSCISHVLSFYRKDREQSFLKEEIETIELLIPHLVEAFRINILNSLQSSLIEKSSLKAIIDRFGKVIEADKSFKKLLTTENLLINEQVQFEIIDYLLPSTLHKNNITIKVQPFNGLFLVELLEQNLIKGLSKKQKEVAELLSKGLVDKKISAILDIKLSTVRYHLKNIYKELGVNSRYEAISYLLGQQ
jgi:DNA-binding CsgD family transcriptional regulator